jgi:parallel beta-helix repeat protein
MKNYYLKSLALVSFLLVAHIASAATYYVSTTGSDSNAGTEALPWKTIQKACNTAAAGDVVNIKAGTYYEKITLNVQGSSSGGFITFQNYGTDKVVVDGTGVSGDYMLYIDSKSYVKIIGLELQNCSTTGLPCGMYITGKGSNVVIKNCKVHDIVNKGTDAHGIALYATDGTTPYSNVIFDGNEVYNCKLGTSESMVMNGNVTNFQIINNVVHDNDNIGIDMIGFEGTASANDQVRNGVCRGNTVYNISCEGNAGYSSGDYSADGIYVDGGRCIVIENNVVHNVNVGIEIASEHANKITDSVTVRNNFISGCDNTGIAFGGYSTSKGWTINCQFLNNTLYNNGTQKMGSGEVMIQKSHDNVFKNNIFYCVTEDVGTSNDFSSAYSYNNKFDYNIWYYAGGADALNFDWVKSSYGTFADYKTASGNDTHSLFVNPLFVSTSDFHIQSTSPAINAGDPSFAAGASETDIDGQTRVSGGRVDIGADEIQAISGYFASTAGSKGLTITPNPMVTQSVINFDNAQGGNYTLTVTSPAGMVVKRIENINTGSCVLKRTDLQPGIYFVNLHGDTNFSGTLLVK